MASSYTYNAERVIELADGRKLAESPCECPWFDKLSQSHTQTQKDASGTSGNAKKSALAYACSLLKLKLAGSIPRKRASLWRGPYLTADRSSLYAVSNHHAGEDTHDTPEPDGMKYAVAFYEWPIPEPPATIAVGSTVTWCRAYVPECIYDQHSPPSRCLLTTDISGGRYMQVLMNLTRGEKAGYSMSWSILDAVMDRMTSPDREVCDIRENRADVPFVRCSKLTRVLTRKLLGAAAPALSSTCVPVTCGDAYAIINAGSAELKSLCSSLQQQTTDEGTPDPLVLNKLIENVVLTAVMHHFPKVKDRPKLLKACEGIMAALRKLMLVSGKACTCGKCVFESFSVYAFGFALVAGLHPPGDLKDVPSRPTYDSSARLWSNRMWDDAHGALIWSKLMGEPSIDDVKGVFEMCIDRVRRAIKSVDETRECGSGNVVRASDFMCTLTRVLVVSIHDALTLYSRVYPRFMSTLISVEVAHPDGSSSAADAVASPTASPTASQDAAAATSTDRSKAALHDASLDAAVASAISDPVIDVRAPHGPPCPDKPRVDTDAGADVSTAAVAAAAASDSASTAASDDSADAAALDFPTAPASALSSASTVSATAVPSVSPSSATLERLKQLVSTAVETATKLGEECARVKVLSADESKLSTELGKLRELHETKRQEEHAVLARLEERSHQLDEREDFLDSELHSFRNVENVKRDISRAVKELETLTARFNTAQHDVDRLTAELPAVRDKAAEAKSAVASVEARFKDVTEKVAELQKRAPAAADAIAARDAVQRDLRTAVKAAEAMQKRLTTAQTRAVKQRERLPALRTKVQEAVERKEKAEQERATAEQAVLQAAGRAGAAHEVEELRTQLAALQGEQKTLAAQLRKAQEECTTTQSAAQQASKLRIMEAAFRSAIDGIVRTAAERDAAVAEAAQLRGKLEASKSARGDAAVAMEMLQSRSAHAAAMATRTLAVLMNQQRLSELSSTLAELRASSTQVAATPSSAPAPDYAGLAASSLFPSLGSAGLSTSGSSVLVPSASQFSTLYNTGPSAAGLPGASFGMPSHIDVRASVPGVASGAAVSLGVMSGGPHMPSMAAAPARPVFAANAPPGLATVPTLPSADLSFMSRLHAPVSPPRAVKAPGAASPPGSWPSGLQGDGTGLLAPLTAESTPESAPTWLQRSISDLLM